jgi:hypothetical protein
MRVIGSKMIIKIITLFLITIGIIIDSIMDSIGDINIIVGNIIVGGRKKSILFKNKIWWFFGK